MLYYREISVFIPKSLFFLSLLWFRIESTTELMHLPHFYTWKKKDLATLTSLVIHSIRLPCAWTLKTEKKGSIKADSRRGGGGFCSPFLPVSNLRSMNLTTKREEGGEASVSQATDATQSRSIERDDEGRRGQEGACVAEGTPRHARTHVRFRKAKGKEEHCWHVVGQAKVALHWKVYMYM